MQSKDYTKSTVIRVAALLVNAVGSLLLLPFMLKVIGENDFGIWSIAATIMSYLTMADFGISIACIRYLSLNIDERKKWDEIVTNSLALSIVMMLIMITAGFVILVLGLMGYAVLSSKDMSIVIGILLVQASIIMVLLVYRGIMRANVKYYELGLFDLSRVVIRLAGLLLILFLGGNLYHLITYNALANVSIYVGYVIYVKYQYKSLFFDYRIIKLDKIKELFNFGKYAILVQIADIFRYRTDNFFIGVAMGLTSVAHYAIAVVLVDMAVQILSRFLSYWETVIMSLIGKQEDDDALSCVFNTLQIGFWVSSFFIVNFYLFGEQVLSMWVGAKYSYLVATLTLLSTVLYLVSFHMSFSPFLNGHYKQKHNAVITGFEVVVKFLLAMPLLKLLGFKGIILATMAPGLIGSVFFRLHLISGISGYSYANLLSKLLNSFFPSIVVPLFFVLISRLLSGFVENVYLHMAVMVLLEVAVYGAIYIKFYKRGGKAV